MPAMNFDMDMFFPNFIHNEDQHEHDMPGDHDGPNHDNPGTSVDDDPTQNQQQEDHTNHNPGGMPHAMSPFLFTRSEDFFVLFEGAFIQSGGAFAGALLLSALFAFVATIFSQFAKVHEHVALRGSPGLKVVGGIMHALRQTVHYFAMLIVMTMNVWLIIAVVVGHGLGWMVYALAFGKRVVAKEKEQSVVKAAADCEC